ncbi:hypothetical protein CMESO_465 (nucleomorph) [Chroomonas mesostigmatica CCMP1168]|uniref:DNA replication complex GINS protein PSF2 N-terminal domain-containing protein n=1 Tax=Chroomonas mesostigmatica CCMP1168 TaxID=1195612 RepID=J7G8P8_9CRYP|nr:hypothetical protein CMESO_465 [Chroomonas mesostigmatica CCMP1168]|mmetsp:Transcript_58846/g.144301  ORF Transcript_58846/g.144301 Transcript_58846/m.144301 type:complete len:180 (-) Transcript_58846:612-1151(-)
MFKKKKKSEENNPVIEKIFSAENLTIRVVFIRYFPLVNLIENQLGPFKKGTKAVIKIWVAIALQKTKYCLIKKPLWLTNKYLEKKIFLERNFKLLQPLPFFYLEIAHILYLRSKEIFFQPENTISFVEELYAVRFSKILNEIQNISGNISVLKFDKIGSIELFGIKKTIQLILFFFSFL